VKIFAMEYVIKLTPEELTPELIEDIKRLLNKDKPFEITLIVKEKPLKEYLFEESRAEYITNLNRAIDDVENNRGLVTFTVEEFEKFVASRSTK
jgi:hypothetical protein